MALNKLGQDLPSPLPVSVHNPKLVVADAHAVLVQHHGLEESCGILSLPHRRDICTRYLQRGKKPLKWCCKLKLGPSNVKMFSK